MSRLIRCWLVSLAFGAPLAAQAASSTDIITGIVTNESGQPLADAVVTILSIETQVTRSTKTNARGRYTILFPDGSGQYRLTVRFIGMVPVQRTIVRQADEDRIVANVKLSSTPVQLEELRVAARRPQGPSNQAPSPGATERNLTTDQVQRLPIDASDLTLLATLVPGVVSITGNDSTPGGFSVAGQRPTSNAVTLDGLTFGGASVPQDAVRNTRVITSSYDPARGQFSGGLVASTTRSGNNQTQGTINYGLRDQDLTVESGDDAFATGFNQHQVSFGFGGPLIKNKLFAFGSGLGRFRGDELQTLLSAAPATLQRFGVAPDSADRLLGLLGTLGVPVNSDLATGSRHTDDVSSLLRLDWIVTQGHTITLRGDYRGNRQEPIRFGQLSVPAFDTRSSQKSGGVMLTANSRFGATVINEFRAYRSSSTSSSPLETALPAGRVQVVSDLDDVRGATNLTFGGLPGLPQRSSGSGFEATNELSLISGNGAHRIKLGGLFNRASSETDATQNRFGTYTYSSLADLEAGRPASYTRTLAPTIRATDQTAMALYAADTWQLSDALQFTYGARFEGAVYSGAPPRNQAAESLFGIRTDRWPTEWRVSPRIGFTWFMRSEDGPPKLVVRGGIGEFRSPAPGSLFSSAQAASGFAGSEAQLVCIGANAPPPDWHAYRADPAAIPTSCVGGGPGPSVPSRSPSITGFDPDFTAPRAVRTSLGVQRRFGLITYGAELSHALGRSQFGVRDLNLGAAQFTLVAEQRPVFVPISAIDPRTGSIPLVASRRVVEYGNVLVFDSELRSRSTQLTLSANGVTRNGAFFNASYTFNRSRDQSSFTFGGAQRGLSGATTAGDPNVREWATSDFQRKHSLLLTMTYPVSRSLELTTITRFTSGSPYTPVVGSDVNGDGLRNDRAFVYGASAAEPAVAAGMARLLGTTSGGAVACLNRQLGRIADRNSCQGPWQTSVDFQLNFRPAMLGLDRRLTMSLVTTNFLIGVDQLLHGQDHLKGWGQTVRPDPTLLVVQGFSPATQIFTYAVNERFGANGTNTIGIRQPFQVGIQLRYTIGPDLMAQLRGQFGGGGQRGGGGGPGQFALRGGAGGGADMVARLTSTLPNPAADVVAIRIALNLTDDQVKLLEATADSLGALTKAVADRAQKELAKAGPNPDPGSMLASMRPVLESVRANSAWALKAIQSILTTDQWNRVPDRIKAPQRQRRDPGGPPQ